MPESLPADTEFVTDDARLAAVLEDAAGHTSIALDMEANSFFRYPEHVSLLQLAVADRMYLIDPFAIDDMSPMGDILAQAPIEKIFHSADFDIRSLDREWGFHIDNLFDTSIAAAFVGMPRLGLGTVLEETLRVVIPKEKGLQRSDWSLRPLSSEALDYAAADVRHLVDLRNALAERLQELGRTSWVTEECARLTTVRHVPNDPENAFLSMKGSRDLDGRGLAILKTLVAFREKEALRRDRPPFRVMPDRAFLFLAENPAVDLTAVPGIGRFAFPPLAARLRDVIREGVKAPPVQRPRRPRYPRPLPEERDRLRLLKEWRTTQGEQLALDAGLLWPMASLERLSRQPSTLSAEFEAPEVRDWQSEEFGESLKAFVATLD